MQETAILILNNALFYPVERNHLSLHTQDSKVNSYDTHL